MTSKPSLIHQNLPGGLPCLGPVRPWWMRAGSIVLSALLLVPLLPSVPRAQSEPDGNDTTETEISSSVTAPEAGSHVISPAPPRPVRPGESLKFTVQYGVIHAGYAWLEVPEVKNYEGHEVFSLLARAESNSFFSHVYRVRNRIESYWDKDGRFSRHYEESRHEGSYKTKSAIDFDYDNRQAVYGDGKTYPIPSQVQDALSAFYYTRYEPLPLGGSVTFDYHASRKTQALEVRVLGREKVKVPAGTFECIAIEPILKAGGIFKNKGRLVIWITDDDRRMPVLMRSKVMIGSISVVLQEMKPGA